MSSAPFHAGATKWFLRFALLVAALAAVSFLLIACGSSSSTSSTTSSSPATLPAGADAKLNAMLPADVRASGVIPTALNAEYPPYEYVGSDGTTLEGIDPDLMAATGKLLGVQFKMVNIPWSSVLPGVQSGRYPLAWSDATDLKSRQKVMDILDYVRQGHNFLFKASATPINTVADAAGKAIAVNQGSDAIGYVEGLSKQLVAEGKAAITMKTFPSQDTAVLAVKSGRVDAMVASTEGNAWAASKSNGVLVTGGPVTFTGVSGIVFPKNSPLLQPIKAALEQLRADGTYDAIMTKWGLKENEVPEFTVNAGTSE